MINEKELENILDELEKQIFSAEVYNDDFDGTSIGNLICLGNVREVLENHLDDDTENEAIKELQKYREIGTVEEFREAVRKQIPKEVKNRKVLKDFQDRPYCIRGDCPKCGCERIKSINTNYCYVCGQHLRWDENLEEVGNK